MRAEVLTAIYAADPALRARVEGATGFAVFGEVGADLRLFATGRGYGVVRDNRSGRDTYLRGVAAGSGLLPRPTLVVLPDAASLARLVEYGPGLGGLPAAERPGVEFFELTSSGVRPGATPEAANYYRDGELD